MTFTTPEPCQKVLREREALFINEQKVCNQNSDDL